MKLLNYFLLLLIPICSFAAEPIPVDQAFTLQAKVTDPNNIQLNWTISPGYQLYRERIKITLATPDAATLAHIKRPKGESRFDPAIGNYQVYTQQTIINIPILGTKAGEAQLIIHYQGCANSGFCYPPIAKKILVHFNHELAATGIEMQTHDATTGLQSNSDQFENLFNHHLALALLIFFGFGILLSFTPCVLPMVPILSGIIVGHGKDLTTAKAFRLSLVYVLSMSITYASIGLVIALLGQNFQSLLQHPVTIVISATIFILLALSMFGLFQLQPPEKLQAWLRSISNRQSAGSYLGVIIMGCIATLIISPCVTAPLVGILTYIAHTQHLVLGAAALFTLSLGMGLPLLLIGTSAGKLLPKAGAWMTTVEYFFGILLIAVAIYLIARIIPGQITMVLWALLLVTSGIFIGAFRKELTTIWQKLAKSLGLLCCLYGALLIIGASMNNTDPFHPLANLQISAQTNSDIKYITVKSINDVKQSLVKSRGKIVVLDFYADWCTACKVMERTTFADPHVIKRLANIVLLKADITAFDKTDQALLQHFDVIAPPTWIFFDESGQQRFKLIGEVKSNEFLKPIRALTTQLAKH